MLRQMQENVRTIPMKGRFVWGTFPWADDRSPAWGPQDRCGVLTGLQTKALPRWPSFHACSKHRGISGRAGAPGPGAALHVFTALLEAPWQTLAA